MSWFKKKLLNTVEFPQKLQDDSTFDAYIIFNVDLRGKDSTERDHICAYVSWCMCAFGVTRINALWCVFVERFGFCLHNLWLELLRHHASQCLANYRMRVSVFFFCFWNSYWICHCSFVLLFKSKKAKFSSHSELYNLELKINCLLQQNGDAKKGS